MFKHGKASNMEDLEFFVLFPIFAKKFYFYTTEHRHETFLEELGE